MVDMLRVGVDIDLVVMGRCFVVGDNLVELSKGMSFEVEYSSFGAGN